MKRILLSFFAAFVISACGYAQDIKIPVNIDKLASKASEVVDVNLDGPALNFARKFLSAEEEDDREAMAIIKDLKGIYVRSFEFDKADEYNEADVEEVRAQLKAPMWLRTVNVRSKRDGEKVDIFFKMEGDSVQGLAIIAAQPRELTIVNIVGPINPDKLSELGGHFGIPKVEPTPKPAAAPKAVKPDGTPKPAKPDAAPKATKPAPKAVM